MKRCEQDGRIKTKIGGLSISSVWALLITLSESKWGTNTRYFFEDFRKSVEYRRVIIFIFNSNNYLSNNIHQ
jgi:hypothetical protein